MKYWMKNTMKITKDVVKLVVESRGGDAPYGWSEDAIHLMIFGKRVETYRESCRSVAEDDAAEWREHLSNWKEGRERKVILK